MFVVAEVVRPAPVVDVFTAFLPHVLGTTPIIISYLTMQLPINFMLTSRNSCHRCCSCTGHMFEGVSVPEPSAVLPELPPSLRVSHRFIPGPQIRRSIGLSYLLFPSMGK